MRQCGKRFHRQREQDRAKDSRNFPELPMQTHGVGFGLEVETCSLRHKKKKPRQMRQIIYYSIYDSCPIFNTGF